MQCQQLDCGCLLSHDDATHSYLYGCDAKDEIFSWLRPGFLQDQPPSRLVSSVIISINLIAVNYTSFEHLTLDSRILVVLIVYCSMDLNCIGSHTQFSCIKSSYLEID